MVNIVVFYLQIGVMLMTAYAFVHAAMQRPDAYTAADKLTNSRNSVAEIGLALGYESEKSFGTAFKRVMNCPPRQYARAKQIRTETSTYSR